MRKSSPLVSIPTVPKTVSDQWLAFSHMANHYRKILNVKPRVDTSAPKFSYNYMDTAPKPSSKLKKVSRKQLTALGEKDVPKSKQKVSSQRHRPLKASDIVDFEYQTLSKTIDSPRRSKKRLESKSNAYQLVFGPSVLQQSQEDLTGDSDFEDQIGGVSTMGISEKIQHFLDQMQEYELNNNHSHEHNLNHPIPNIAFTNGRKGQIRSREELNESYMARHSKCFIPVVENTRNKKPPFDNSITTSPIHSTFTKSNPKATPVFNSDHSLLMKKKNLRNSTVPSPKTTPKRKSVNKIQISKTAQGILDTERRNLDQAQNFENTQKRKATRNKSPSSASVGTIRGSDELTESRLLPLPGKVRTSMAVNRRNNREHSVQIEDQDMSSKWLKEKVDKGLIRINNAYFQLGNGTSLATSVPAFGILNNKDSSRDSAYGFSSGESRITTRESTPEKIGNSTKAKAKIKKQSPDMGKYKSSLSTVASSTNQDSPARSLKFQSNSRRAEHKEKEYPKSKLVRTNANNWMSENRYIDFLTSVTDDIVSRGIYTNKGLKTLFQSHIDKNPELEVDKMSNMLNRLRMDVGIPMDDTLNQLEFGYGSVKYSTQPFFYRCNPITKNTVSGSSNSKACNIESDVSVYELHHRQGEDYQSTDEGNSRASSCSVSMSVINENNGSCLYDSNNPVSCNSISQVSSQSSKDSLSLAESEIANALKEVGFDSESTLDIVKIVSHQTKPKKKSSGLPQHQVPSPATTKTKLKSLKSNRSNFSRSSGY